MKLYILSSVLLLAVLCSPQPGAALEKFGQLCSGNLNNQIRGCDDMGCGYYGAPRGDREHMGVDVNCKDGAGVYAPFDLTIVGQATPYANTDPINDGLELSGGGHCFLVFYIDPVKYSGTLKKGEYLGTMLPMQKVYPGITSHVHVQMCDLSDPTEFM